MVFRICLDFEVFDGSKSVGKGCRMCLTTSRRRVAYFAGVDEDACEVEARPENIPCRLNWKAGMLGPGAAIMPDRLSRQETFVIFSDRNTEHFFFSDNSSFFGDFKEDTKSLLSFSLQN